MTTHDTLGREAREHASLYALGALSGPEAADYRDHLDRCTACRAEVATLLAPVAELSLLAPEAEPSPGLRRRVLDAVRTGDARASDGDGAAASRPSRFDEASPAVQAAARAKAPITVFPGGLDLAFAEGAEWEKTSIAGIEMRRLSLDEEADRLTVLIRMAAGASYPSHRHGGPEECYVISGDLSTGDIRMRAGDYKLAHKGSVDRVQSTEKGCLLLIVSSLKDELVPGAGASPL